jgi:hypothetical protein|tara:strand:+ start:182 stop:877 length:696 start_codon:yes stop_codon:yes gene_type:complete
MKNSPLKLVDPLSMLVMSQAGNIAGGITGIASGIIGSKARRQEEREAQSEYDRYKTRLEDRDTSNPYANMENVYEDLTVNTQAADFAAQQQNQGMANTMDQFRGSAGGSGIAALAQAMAGQQAINAQRASVDIGQQERSNLMAERGMASQLQTQERQGELMSRQMENQKVNTLLGMSQGRLGAARQARAQAQQAIMGGIGQLAGGASNVGQMATDNLQAAEGFNELFGKKG